MRKRCVNCLVCGHPKYPNPGHECMLYPEAMMAKVYGEDWRKRGFDDYDTRYRDMKRRVHDDDMKRRARDEHSRASVDQCGNLSPGCVLDTAGLDLA